jgi:hypothetical protein
LYKITNAGWKLTVNRSMLMELDSDTDFERLNMAVGQTEDGQEGPSGLRGEAGAEVRREVGDIEHRHSA